MGDPEIAKQLAWFFALLFTVVVYMLFEFWLVLRAIRSAVGPGGVVKDEDIAGMVYDYDRTKKPAEAWYTLPTGHKVLVRVFAQERV